MAKRGLSSWDTALYWPKRNFHQAWPKQNFASKEHIYSIHRSPEKREVVSIPQSGNGIKRKGGHVTDHVIKEHNREDRSWLLRDSWVRRGGSKDPKLMKRKRRFKCQLLLIVGIAWSAQQIPMAVNLGFLYPEPLLFHSSSSSVILMRLSGPSSRPTTSQKIW
jgi:hypothetical protein